MKVNEFKDGMILAVDYSWLGRSMCYYVVCTNEGNKVALCFQGNANNGDRPQGWLDLSDKNYSPLGLVAVYKAKAITNTFNGNFDDATIYDKLWDVSEVDK